MECATVVIMEPSGLWSQNLNSTYMEMHRKVLPKSVHTVLVFENCTLLKKSFNRDIRRGTVFDQGSNR